MSELDLLRRLGDQIAPPSFDALRETARARTRRTATFTAVVAAAAVVSVLAVAHTALTENHSGPEPVKNPLGSTRPLTYAEGATLHFGEQSVTMPGDVVEIDMVDGGAVARTSDGAIWLTDGSPPEQIGTLGTPAPPFKPDLPYYYGDGVGFVVSNNAGSLVGWFEFPQPSQPELVVYDTASGEETARQPVEVQAGSGAVLTSVSEQYAYFDVDPVPFEDPASVGRIDLVTGEQIKVTTAEQEPAPLPVGTPRTILVSHREDVEAGDTPPPPSGAQYQVDDGIHQQLGVHSGHLEPLGEQPLQVFDGATGTPLTALAWPQEYTIPKNAPGWLTQWIDDDTFVIDFNGYQGKELSDLLVCHISTRACDVVAQNVDAVVPDIG
jgi:hypothetical protein